MNVSSKGPFGEFYRVWGDGKQMVEGDSSTFLMLVDNGLRSHEHPGWGGWGGRLAENPADPSEWSSTGVADRDPQGNTPPDYAAQRWFGAAQRDFAARMQWSVTPEFEDADHHPKVSVRGRLDRTARRGEVVTLNADARDPDGDALTYRWWHYREAGTYPGAVTLSNPDSERTRLQVPADAARGQTILAILEVTDSGSPALTSYRRVVITVQGRNVRRDR